MPKVFVCIKIEGIEFSVYMHFYCSVIANWVHFNLKISNGNKVVMKRAKPSWEIMYVFIVLLCKVRNVIRFIFHSMHVSMWNDFLFTCVGHFVFTIYFNGNMNLIANRHVEYKINKKSVADWTGMINSEVLAAENFNKLWFYVYVMQTLYVLSNTRKRDDKHFYCIQRILPCI